MPFANPKINTTKRTNRKYDWEALRDRWMKGEFKNIPEMAKALGISQYTLEAKATADGWIPDRAKLTEQVRDSSDQIIMADLIRLRVAAFRRQHRLTQLMQSKGVERLTRKMRDPVNGKLVIGNDGNPRQVEIESESVAATLVARGIELERKVLGMDKLDEFREEDPEDGKPKLSEIAAQYRQLGDKDLERIIDEKNGNPRTKKRSGKRAADKAQG